MASSLTLPSLLPSTSFLIAYSLPLLLISLVLTFAGAFLTLDRTRRFKPRYDALPMPGMLAGKKEGTWIKELMVFEGGVGGMLLGYAFGLHLSTFLALIIPSTSSTESSLSSSAFLAVWLLSSISTAILGARYTLAALIFGGLSGGALFALGVCVMIHPGLTTRIIFTAVLMIILPISILLTTFIPPLLRFKHPLVRFASSATGAFGLTLSIALLASPSAGLSWASAWSHLSLSGSTSWGTSLEKGYSAVFCFLLILGSAADWFLWKQYGENPDEKWDGYLAEYAANLPNDKRRAGTFEPFAGFWAGLFGSKQVQSGNSKSLLFPLADIEMGSDFDADVKIPSSPLMSTSPAGKLRKSSYEKGFESTDDPLPLYSSPPGVLKRGRKSRSKGSRTAARGFRKKEVVKFRPLNEVSESESSSDEGSRTGLDALTRQRPWLRAMSSATSSTPTLVDSPSSSAQHKSKATPTSSSRDDEELDYVKEVSRLKAAMKRRTGTGTVSPGLSDGETGSYPPDYSDFEEEDIVSAKTKVGGTTEQEKEWTPGFLRRHRSSVSSHPSTSSPSAPAPMPTLPILAPTALVPVPATPSLIHALDRVEKARREAFSPPAASAPAPRTEGLPSEDRDGDGDETDTSEGRGQRWQDFWREVKAVKGEMR